MTSLAPIATARAAPVADVVPPSPARMLTGPQKAAVVVRLLLAEGTELPLSSLPEEMQESLTQELARMRAVDRVTLRRVVEEFLRELEGIGLTFPGGIDHALALLGDRISPPAASRLRRGGRGTEGDPWDRIGALPPEQILRLLADEGAEVAAVALSRLPVAVAADLLSRMPGERARRVVHTVSLISGIAPATVDRIGAALAARMATDAPRAFAAVPAERVGAILNSSPAATRDDLLRGLEAEDAPFAEAVRRNIFTFADIPHRLVPRDVPKVLRGVDQPVLIAALAGAAAAGPAAEAAEFLLANMSQRLATSLREEMAEAGAIREKDADRAQSAIVTAIRTLESAGEIALTREDEPE